MDGPAQGAGAIGARLDGNTARSADGILRWVLALLTLGSAYQAMATGANPVWPGVAAVCAGAHALPRAPRAASSVSLALGAGALHAGVISTLLAAGIVVLSVARLVLHFGERGAWLLGVHALEVQRRRTLIATGLATGPVGLSCLAGDLYEQAGLARRALTDLGAHPRKAEGWRVGAAYFAAFLRALPGTGKSVEAAIARATRALARRAGARTKGNRPGSLND